MKPLLAAILLVAACGGDDEGGATPKAAGAAGTPAAVAAGGSNVAVLVPMPHVEDRVTCPVPKKTEDLPPAEDRCDPQAVIPCKDKAKPYCLTVPVASNAAYCFQCLERDNIRHSFKDRDFASEQNRDPFQSFVLSPAGIGSGSGSAVVDVNTTVKCKEANSFMPSYSYLDLHLVGIVTQGTLRKGLITGGRTNAIIRRNDCVGKEKALVKEVGDGFTTFITQPDPAIAGARAVEYTLLLRPNNTLALGSPELPPDGSTTPSNVPSPNVPSPNQKTPPQPQGTTTRVEIPSPKQPPPTQIPSPQLNLNP